jgi:phosphinothricin acetyltransferase
VTATIRLATASDAEQIAAIYAPFVLNTPTSFEMEPPSADEMAARIVSTLERYPWLVCSNGEVMGYAYASAFRSRTAYQWSVDTTVYTHDRFRRVGVGRALYTSLLAALRIQGFCSACAGIALPNPGSEGLHRAMGFEQVALYRRIGYKLGRWHDVGWWQLSLRSDGPAESPPAPLCRVVGAREFTDALYSGLSCLRTDASCR